MSTSVDGLAPAGLCVERLLEPKVTGRSGGLAPIHENVPVALLVRCTRRGLVCG